MLSEKRAGRVTASIVGGILGCAPYMSRKDAMKTMMGISTFEGNVATEYGNFHESGAIFDFELETGLSVDRTGLGFVIHPEYDWLGATPDGLCSDGALLEVKCPYGLRDDAKPVFKPIKDQPHYYAQVQIQLFVTGKDKCHFWQWSPKDGKHELVHADDQWLEWNLPEIFAFYHEYLEQKDRDIGGDLVAEYDELKQRIKDDEARCKEIMAELVEMTGGKGGKIYGNRFLTKVERKGSVAYAKVVKDLLPADTDLTKYTGKPTEYWTLK